MPYCVPPIVNSWSMKGAWPNTNPERAVSPITNRTGAAVAPPPNCPSGAYQRPSRSRRWKFPRSEEHTSELQSRLHLVCRLLLEKKKKKQCLTCVQEDNNKHP